MKFYRDLGTKVGNCDMDNAAFLGEILVTERVARIARHAVENFGRKLDNVASQE